MRKDIDLYTNIIFRVFLGGVIIWFLYTIKSVIALLFVSIIMTAALNPIIKQIKKKFKLRLAFATIIVYACFLLISLTLVSFILPIITRQLSSFTKEIYLFTQSNMFLNLDISIKDLGTQISKTVSNILSTTVNLFSAVVSLMAVLSMSFYMSLKEDGLKKIILIVTPARKRKYTATLIDRIQESFGRWMLGQLFTMLFVGILYYVVLASLGIPYAPILALFGGLLEIIPYFGPILASVPSIIFGFSISPTISIITVIAYIIINLIENQLLIPKIMNKAIGLDPVFVILALLIGAKIAGIIGLFLAVPIAGAIGLFLKDVINRNYE